MKIKLITFLSRIVLLFFALGVVNSAFAIPQVKPSSDCKAYSIPLDPIPCGSGYTGVKFPLKVKVCPSGVVTTGQTFNTENCRKIGDVVDPTKTDCAITPTDARCVSKPAPRGCRFGQHWVTTGSGIAHCVLDDFPCPWGERLEHDTLGNPFCVANTCPGNQVLQADGISCACAPGLVWDGATCVAVCTPSNTTQTDECPLGYSGTRSRLVTVSCPSGTTSYGAWNTSACVKTVCPADAYIPASCPSGSGTAWDWYRYTGADCHVEYMGRDESGCSLNPPTCPADKTTYSSCPVGQTGQIATTIKYAVVNGVCKSSTTVDNSSCVPVGPSCPSDTVTTNSCGVGFTGSEVTTTTYVGASCTPSVSKDRSLCVPIGPSCPSDIVTTNSCGVGFTGSEITTTTYVGASCTPSVSKDRSLCVPIGPTCPKDTVTTSSCGSGFTGLRVITTTYVGASCMPSTTIDTSACSCKAPETIQGTCPAPQSGNTIITTTYSGASCTASTTINTSACVTCTDIPGTENAACPVGFNGSRTRSTLTNSCTRIVSYGVWDESNCTPTPIYCPDGSVKPPSGECPVALKPCDVLMPSLGYTYGITWGGTGSYCYNQAGNDAFPAESNLAKKCASLIILEVTRVNRSTGVMVAGYMCSPYGTILYDPTGKAIP